MSIKIEDALRLETRTELPEALRVLLAEFPKSGWNAHPNFKGLVEFWLNRHGMFRQICQALTAQRSIRRQSTSLPAGGMKA